MKQSQRYLRIFASAALVLGGLVAYENCSHTNSADPSGSSPSSTAGASSPTNTLNVAVAPISEPGNTEDVRCVTLRAGNHAVAFARRFHLTLDPGIAQVIVYRSNATSEVASPGVVCPAFSGLAGTQLPLFMSNSFDTDLTFPSDGGHPIGVSLSTDQMLTFEVHLYNPTTLPASAGVSLSIDVMAPPSDAIEGNLIVSGTSHISLAPHSIASASSFRPALTGLHVFALNTQQWHFGIGVVVYSALNATDTSTQIYDNGGGSARFTMFDPALDLTGKGLLTVCDSNNTSNLAVHFGPSVLTDESCLSWEYYYPSAGFQACLNGACSTFN